MSFDPNNVPLQYLLQPELLSENDIYQILKARCIRVDNMEYMNKEQLLNLCYRIITPKQQRTNTRRSSGANIEQPDEPVVNKKSKNPNSEDNPGISENRNIQTNGSVNVSKVQLKRNYNTETQNEEPTPKKARQKICWP